MENKKNNENFIIRLFDVIDLPLFLYLSLTVIIQAISTQEFYFENMIIIGLISFAIGVFLQGMAGYRAVKNKLSYIKPWLAGLSVALIVSVFSLFLSVALLVYFPNPIMGYDEIISSSDEEIVIDGEVVELKEDEILIDEDVDFDEENENFDLSQMGKGGWSDPLVMITLIGGLFGLLFSALLGALWGFLGGVIGKD